MIKIKRITDTAIFPVRGSEYSAGWDLCADISDDLILKPAETFVIGTGWAIEIPKGYFGAIFARSGLATKEGLRPANCVGVVDSDYRGQIKIAIHNDTLENKVIPARSRIAQLVLIPYLNTEELEEVEHLSNTNRGTGGFGSTGQ